MMTVTLTARARRKLLEHFLGLAPEDRHLRFGCGVSDAVLASYVNRLDFERDAVFGVFSDDLRLIGVAHLALEGPTAELGVSVLGGYRRRGIGSALVSRAAAHARNHSIRTLFMHCLAENDPMIRIARRLGMQVVTDGAESDAHMALPAGGLVSRAVEWMEEGMALCDISLRARFRSARRLIARVGANASKAKTRHAPDSVAPRS